MSQILVLHPDPKQLQALAMNLSREHKSFDVFAFASLENLEDSINNPSTPRKASALSSGVPKPNQSLQALSLVVVDVPLFGTSIDKGLDHLLAELRNFNLIAEGSSPPIIVTDYENGLHHPSQFAQMNVQDLVYQPVDWPLFLQKTRIALGSSEKTADAEHLYSHLTRFPIYLGREDKLNQIGEFGFMTETDSGAQPPDKIQLFLDREIDPSQTPLTGKLHKSLPHEEKSLTYCHYYIFFGAASETLKGVRNYLKDYRGISVNWQYLPGFQKRSSEAAQSSEKNFIVVDSHDETRESINSVLTENFKSLRTETFSSYQRFLKTYLSPSAAPPPPDENKIADTFELWFPRMETPTLIINPRTLDLLRVTPSPNLKSRLFHQPVKKFFEERKHWLQSIKKESLTLLVEAYKSLKPGITRDVLLWAIHGTEELPVIATVCWHKEPDLDAPTIRLALHPVTAKEWKEHQIPPKKFSEIHGFFVNQEFIPEPPSPWLKSFRSNLFKLDLPSLDLRFFALGSPLQKSRLNSFSESPIDDYFMYPADRGYLIRKLILHFPKTSYTRTANTEMELLKRTLPYYIAKQAQACEVSEYGIKLIQKQAVDEGEFFTLFHPLFLDDHQQRLLIRCYKCQPHKHDSFLVSYHYYGVRDSFLKKIRSWIRQSYAEQKAAS